ncbi:MAG: hypothetical protein M3Q79_02735 [bacterium]|nr:hypothetical protein [bacterium]
MPKRDILQKRLYLVIIGGLLTTVVGIFTVFALVNNSKQSKLLYDQLIAVDSAGGDVEAALSELRTHIYSHMNTSIGSPNGVYPPIQLKGTYDRLVASEQAKQADGSDLYNQAQADCERRFPGGLSGRNRIPCITEYIGSRSEQAVLIPDGLYKFDFVSPRWSPDAAGFGLLLTVALGMFTLFNLALLWHYRSILRKSF